VVDALNNDNFNDFEDCLQMESSQTVNADYIITRNIVEDFLKLFDDVRK
jgi:hypothetical protein